MFSILTWVVLSLCCSGVLPVLVNRTIDDFYGDSVTGALPVYSPSDGWTSGNTCVGCRFNSSIADVNKTFDKTWHDATYLPSHCCDLVSGAGCLPYPPGSSRSSSQGQDVGLSFFSAPDFDPFPSHTAAFLDMGRPILFPRGLAFQFN